MAEGRERLAKVSQSASDAAVRTDGYLEAALEEVLAGDYVCDFGLVQTVSDGRRSQSGVKGDDCEIQLPLGLSFLHHCCHECARV